MDKTARVELLRLRFKAKGGIPFVGTGVRKPAKRTEPGQPIRMAWPQIIPDTKRAPGWMKVANPVAQVVPRIKRTHRPVPLVQIAEKAPKKLARVYRNAEAFAASRGQQ